MALSSGSSVSEDVPTLIKMCRASGLVCRFSLFFLCPSPLPSRLINRSILLALQLFNALYACDRGNRSLRFLKRSGSVTWMAAARSSKRQVAIRGPRMCRHFLPPIDRLPSRPAATPFGAGRGTRGLCLRPDTR